MPFAQAVPIALQQCLLVQEALPLSAPIMDDHCGARLALAALLEGYDTYICADQTVTADPPREQAFLERIRYCNGHIVTIRQILLELLSQERDPNKRAPVESLLRLDAAS